MNIHGQWELTLVNDVLIRSTAGHFNLAGSQASFLEMQEKAPKNRPWAFLENGHNWEMSSEESLLFINEIKEWKFQNGCQFAAIITPSVISKRIYQFKTDAKPSDKVKYFDHIESAAVWLTEQGFPFSMDDFPHHEFMKKTSTIT